MNPFTDEPSCKRRVKRPPLVTIKEMADEIGVNRRALAAILGHDPCSPKPRLDNRSYSSFARVCWYDRREFLKWWNSRGKAT